MAHNPVFEHLHHLKISDIVSSDAGPVVFVTSNNTVEETVRVLSSKGIQSCAVVESSNKEKPETGTCIGVVDVLDIVSFIVSVAPDAASLTRNELQSLEICGRAIAFEPIANVINASGKDPYVPLSASDPVTMLTEIFSKGIHRMPILSDGDESTLVHSLSQSDVVQYLSTQLHMGKLKLVGEKSAADLGLVGGQQTVFKVSKKDRVLDALQLLKEKGVSALAVVEDEEEGGKLAGNFSASDLKGLYQEHFPSLLLPVGEYLEKHSPKSLQPICASAETSLLELTKELASSHVHRVWVLDAEYRPTGVISLTDIMRVVHDYQHL